MTVLGIDWGEKHIGLALGWTDIGFSQPLTTVDVNQAIAKILSVCKTNSIGRIIIGVSEAESGRKARSFAEKLQDQTEITVELADETLSSAQAESLRQDHAAAAAIILELWLDEHRQNKV